jgi:hypothetical protein
MEPSILRRRRLLYTRVSRWLAYTYSVNHLRTTLVVVKSDSTKLERTNSSRPSPPFYQFEHLYLISGSISSIDKKQLVIGRNMFGECVIDVISGNISFH